ncbi:MAG: acyl carrier protein [Methylococcales bacterium]
MSGRLSALQQKLRDFIFNELIFISDPENFGERDDLLDAGLDSMGIMRLVIFIENEFDVRLPDAEIDPDHLLSLDALQHWILSNKKG